LRQTGRPVADEDHLGLLIEMREGRVTGERVPSGQGDSQARQLRLDIANVARAEPPKPAEQIMTEALRRVFEVGEVAEMQESLSSGASQLLLKAVVDHGHELIHAGLARQIDDRRRCWGSIRGGNAGRSRHPVGVGALLVDVAGEIVEIPVGESLVGG
jgi:hypothetical protein